MKKNIKILNAEPSGYSPQAKKILRSIGPVTECSPNRKQLLKLLQAYDVLIVRLKFQIDREMINAGKKLKVIVSATTGLDHIDVDYVRRRGIKILSLKGKKEFLKTVPATAEHTWALVLALMRRIPEAAEAVKKGHWNRDRLRGHDLAGKRLGIIGFGRIGKKVAAYGKVFGMEIRFWDPKQVSHPSYAIRQRTLNQLMKKSDVLCIHAALTGTSKKMISGSLLKLLPKGAYVINTARGEILGASALLKFLRQKKLGGAALDVIPGERAPGNKQRKALLAYAKKNSNLILTPHIGGATVESMTKTEVFMAERLKILIQKSFS